MAKKKASYSKGYSKYLTKRPMWEWIVIYVVIGLVVYAAIYFFVIAKNSPMNSAPTSGSQSTTSPAYRLPGY